MLMAGIDASRTDPSGDPMDKNLYDLRRKERDVPTVCGPLREATASSRPTTRS